MKSDVPDGVYAARFVGCEAMTITQVGRNHDDKIMDWQFRILAGAYAESIVSRHTGRRFADGTKCGKMVELLTTAVDGKPLPGSLFHPVLYEGSVIRIAVRNGIISDVWSPTVIRVRKGTP